MEILIIFLLITIVNHVDSYLHIAKILNQFRTRDISSTLSNKVIYLLKSSHESTTRLNTLNPTNAINVISKLSLIKNDPWYVWMIISFSSTLGIALEKTNFGATLSSPLVSMCFTLLLCNIGLLPTKSTVYSTVMKNLVPLAIPLLLLDADMKKCFKNTGTLLKAFLIGSVGTIIGTIVAYILVPMRNLPSSHLIASALCSRHIGGAVNFVAVSEILKAPSDLVAASMAADNVIVALYFSFLFAISSSSKIQSKLSFAPNIYPTNQIDPLISNNSVIFTNHTNNSIEIINEDNIMSKSNDINLLTLSSALSLGILLYSLSYFISILLPFELSPVLLVSLFAVIVATSFPKTISKISHAGGIIGVLLMQMFFAVTGSMGHIPTVLKFAPSLFLHTFIQIFVHFIFTLFIGKQLNIPFNEIIIASNANVGGPTTAAAMASNKRWQNLVLPALLTGVFGYAIATIVGVLISKILIYL